MSQDRQFRTNAISVLASEISTLTGGSFEIWGYRMVSWTRRERDWSHRGTTTYGAPVGYTVDSSGDNACVVAQYSSEKDYFEGGKPLRDLNNTVKKHAHVEEVILFAAAEASPSERTSLDNMISTWRVVNPHVHVVLRDARQLAETIVDNLDSDELVNSLKDHLPSLAKLADEEAISHFPPVLAAYVQRAEIERDIAEALAKSRYVALVGISGVGKSNLAVASVHQLDVESRFWIDASGFQRPEDLLCVEVARRGTQHNLVHMLKTRSCALVLDNLPALWSHAEFEKLVGDRSVVLVTSQTSRPGTVTINVGNVDEACARKMLEATVAAKCPEPVFEAVYSATGGHPLLLRILAQVAAENSGRWSMVSALCEQTPIAGADEKNQKVCRRVLRSHLPDLRAELGVFVWCGAAGVDKSLLAACSSGFGVANLDRRCFLAASELGVARLHDVVYKSALVEIMLEPSEKSRYRDLLAHHIERQSEGDALDIQRLARKHHSRLLQELRSGGGAAFVYAVSLARADPSVVQDLSNVLEQVRALDAGSARPIDIRAAIEAIEAIHSLTTEKESKRAAQDSIRPLMEAFVRLKDLAPSLSLEIRHHEAKMLMRLDEWADAELRFRELLQEEPSLNAAKLQLVRILARSAEHRIEAVSLATEIVDASTSNAGIAVKLSAWAELARLDAPYVAGRSRDVVELLSTVGRGEIGSAYGLVTSVVAHLSGSEPEAALAVFRAMGDEDPYFSNDRERLEWGRALTSAAKAQFELPHGAVDAAELLTRARSIYESVRSLRWPEFYRVQFAETLLLADDVERAKEVLDKVDESERKEYWWHRSAEVCFRLGDLAAADFAITTALQGLSKAVYRGAFLHLRSEIRRRSGDSRYVEDLREAIANEPDARLRDLWQSELNSYTGGTS